MRSLFLRTVVCALLFTFLGIGAGSERANAMAGSGGAYGAQPQARSIRRGSHAARKHRTRKSGSGRSGQHSIIFVGGKPSKTGAARRSNPTRAKKSNGSLNPQPIPPGKQH